MRRSYPKDIPLYKITSSSTRQGNVRLTERMNTDGDLRLECQQALCNTVYDFLETHIRYITDQSLYKPVDFSIRNLLLVGLAEPLDKETLSRILAPSPNSAQHYYQSQEGTSSSSGYISDGSVDDEDIDEEDTSIKN